MGLMKKFRYILGSGLDDKRQNGRKYFEFESTSANVLGIHGEINP